jgi:hypothetical protein
MSKPRRKPRASLARSAACAPTFKPNCRVDLIGESGLEGYSHNNLILSKKSIGLGRHLPC